MSNEASRARLIHLVELEFEYLQKANDKIDNSRFLIKGWAVTATGALLALSVSASNFGLALIGLVIVPSFAYLEALYMYMGEHVIARSDHVERLLDSTIHDRNSLAESDYSFGISQAFKGRFEAKGVLSALRGRPHIYVLYVGLLVATATDALVLKLFA